MLYGVGPMNATVLAAVACTLLATALLACLVPARRAASVDPMAPAGPEALTVRDRPVGPPVARNRLPVLRELADESRAARVEDDAGTLRAAPSQRERERDRPRVGVTVKGGKGKSVAAGQSFLCCRS
jgi:hypothetical protein